MDRKGYYDAMRIVFRIIRFRFKFRRLIFTFWILLENSFGNWRIKQSNVVNYFHLSLFALHIFLFDQGVLFSGFLGKEIFRTTIYGSVVR